jgi:hypothetical protein
LHVRVRVLVLRDTHAPTDGGMAADGSPLDAGMVEAGDPYRSGFCALSIVEGDHTPEIQSPQFPKSPPPGEWARFDIDVDLDAATVQARVNDAPTFTTVAGWSAAFDNVTCDSR